MMSKHFKGWIGVRKNESKPSREWRWDQEPWPDMALWHAWRSEGWKWSALLHWVHLSSGRAAQGLHADRDVGVFKGNLETCWSNGSHYWGNFVSRHADLPDTDSVVIVISSGSVGVQPVNSIKNCYYIPTERQAGEGFNPPATVSVQGVNCRKIALTFCSFLSFQPEQPTGLWRKFPLSSCHKFITINLHSALIVLLHPAFLFWFFSINLLYFV